MSSVRKVASASPPFATKLRTAITRRFLTMPPDEATFAKRGFHSADLARQAALESVGKTFLCGYNAALDAEDLGEVLQIVRALPAHRRGFAAEGAAMGFAVADALPFGKARLPDYLAAIEGRFVYLGHVGVGWAMARLPWRRRALLAELDPLLRWLAFDGMGFHDAYFNFPLVRGGWRRQRVGYAARAYDQGVGRALWFVSGGAIDRALQLVGNFSPERQGDLWSGLGLAMTYAGPAAADDIAAARGRSREFAAHFAQGAAFACEAYALAGEIPAHADNFVRELTGQDALTLSALVRDARALLTANDEAETPRYETWRRNVAIAMVKLLEQRS